MNINVTIRLSKEEKKKYAEAAKQAGRSLAGHLAYLVRNSNAK